MSPLLETIKLKDGILFNMKFHNVRFNEARKEYYGIGKKIELEDLISVPDKFKTGLFRCRIIYSPEIEKIEFIEHQYRKVSSLKIIEDNMIDYRYKYTDRAYLTNLSKQCGDADDIIIIKNGFVTDSFTANPIFYDGNKWWTSDTPLLAGTQRAKLLDENKIFECRIALDDIFKFKKIGLINAMQDMEDMPLVPISNVFKT